MELNVNKVEDCFYRYKMPRLIAKVEGKGNGIKTVIVNMAEIAKAIYRKPAYPTKYFGFELGAQIKLDEKNDRYIVNGSHEANKLQEVLYGFIKKFVLCQSCDNPETSLLPKKPNLLYKCRACGYSDQIDPTHRLTGYIIKNPPDTEAEGAFIEQETIEKEDDEIENWSENIQREPEELNVETLSIKDIKIFDSEKSKAIRFREYVEELFNTREIITDRDKIESNAFSSGLDLEYILVIMEIVFCNRDTVIDDIERYKGLFLYITRRGLKDTEKQEMVLRGMETLIDSLNILSKSCHFLKALYDSDIVEEETILHWYDNGPYSTHIDISLSKNILHECVKMIEWLKEADEESDED